jgi:hypothetical protein
MPNSLPSVNNSPTRIVISGTVHVHEFVEEQLVVHPADF